MSAWSTESSRVVALVGQFDGVVGTRGLPRQIGRLLPCESRAVEHGVKLLSLVSGRLHLRSALELLD